MTRRIDLVRIVLGLLLMVPAMTSIAAAPPPNILFIFTDDHAPAAIGAYGSRINETPNLDRIAAAGMRFDNCFVTNAICAPSRAVILTGKHSHVNGVTTNAHTFDGSQVTFPKLFQQAGYRTGLIGKWHLKSDPTGFDHWEVLIGQGPYYNPTMIRNGEKVQHVGYTTDLITDKTLAWLREQRDGEQPFLLMCQHKAPHRHWVPGPDHLDDFDGVRIPEPPTLLDDYAGRGPASKLQEMTIARHLSPHDLKLVNTAYLNPEQLARVQAAYADENEAIARKKMDERAMTRWKYQRYIKDYLRCVASVDDGVGRILDELDRLGLAENTIVVYSSDQGWFLGEHGWYDKRWMYEESLRMPLLVRWPGVVEPGSTCDAFVQNLDFAPTLLAAAGVTAPKAMQGHDAGPLLRGETPGDWRQSVYYHYYENPGAHNVPRHYGVRTKRYKLIHFYRLDSWELYDLERDPDEMTNLADDPAHADVVTKLREELTRLRRQYGVTDEADLEYDEMRGRGT